MVQIRIRSPTQGRGSAGGAPSIMLIQPEAAPAAVSGQWGLLLRFTGSQAALGSVAGLSSLTWGLRRKIVVTPRLHFRSQPAEGASHTAAKSHFGATAGVVGGGLSQGP